LKRVTAFDYPDFVLAIGVLFGQALIAVSKKEPND
jgi:hypothetical protein